MISKKQIEKVREEFWTRLTFIFDLDGTLYLGKKVLPGALELMWNLESQRKDYFYLTNNSSRSEEDYEVKLKKMGFPADPKRIIMSTHLLVEELLKHGMKKVFVLGTPAMHRMLRRRGIHHSARLPDAVVVGFDKTLTYAKLETAVRLVEKGAPYIVTHPDLFCPTESGPEPDCGAFAKVIELVTGKPPLWVLGKPNPKMLKEVSRRSRFQKSATVIIGDRLTTDISMAKAAEVSSILVLSGETKFRMLTSFQRKSLTILPSVKDLLW